jgi:hypothetical protein
MWDFSGKYAECHAVKWTIDYLGFSITFISYGYFKNFHHNFVDFGLHDLTIISLIIFRQITMKFQQEKYINLQFVMKSLDPNIRVRKSELKPRSILAWGGRP